MALRRSTVFPAISIAAALSALALVTVPVVRDLFSDLELRTLDWRMRSGWAYTAGDADKASPRAEQSRIRLVLFDTASVRDWPYLVPFPRDILAQLIETVSAQGASVIGLDVFLEERYPELDRFGNGDEKLREAIRKAGNVVLPAVTEEVNGVRMFRPPDPYFADVAAAIGIADLPTPYETIRGSYLTVRTDQGLKASFPLAVYSVAERVPLDSLLAATEASGVLPLHGLPPQHARLSSRAFQTQPLLFVGPPSRPGRQDGAFQAFSSADVLALGEFMPESWLRGKVVLLGSGFHAEERFRSPFYDHRQPEGDIYGWTYGVEVHANSLEGILTGIFPIPLDTGKGMVPILFLLATVVVGVVARWGVGAGAFVGVALLIGNVLSAWQLFDSYHIHLPVVAPTLSVVFAFLGATAYVSLVEGRDKRVLRQAFGKYVSPSVVDQLVNDPSRLRLGGEKRPISILFSDLAGFTSVSEAADPEALVSLLNDYLEEMAEIVIAQGGTLDKYIGDAVMALFGAPISNPHHAVHACKAALRMQRRLRELNRAWAKHKRPALRMRIGINTGTPIVGNIGGERRFDYTAIGDAVNLAARLEPACKNYGVEIMIAEATRVLAAEAIVVRELDLLAVYGKVEPVPVFELLGMAGEVPPREMELLELYERGLLDFRSRDFTLARQHFLAAREVDPEDGPTNLYLRRCEELIAAPPAENWDFVLRLSSK